MSILIRAAMTMWCWSRASRSSCSAPPALTWLSSWLRRLDQLPADLANQGDAEAAAQRLLDTACDLEISPGVTIQWFAIRLDPPG